jgi:prephenate dehydratase
MLKVAIQGGRASFHDIAAHQFFEKDLQVIECDTFRKVCLELESENADYALMAIENSIAGSILENYSLIEEYGHFVCGEYKLRIKQNLMALRGQKIDDIKIARSHYMALLQCNEFFEQYPHIKLEKYHDTADSAKDIKANNLLGIAAIAGERAAEIYDLEILAEGIETEKKNYTRFLVLTKSKKFLYPKNELNKATLSFELPDRVGALADALKAIVDNGINLTKIQSIPILGKPDNYTFYIDCQWNMQSSILNCYRQMKKIISKMTVLGEYKNHSLEL